jgi:hypothetical protein
MTSPRFRTNPSLGPNLAQVVRDGASYYDHHASPQTGDTSQGDDGRLYMWVEASGAITVGASGSGTQVALTVNGPGTDPRVTAATGSGGWYGPTNASGVTGNLAAGDRFWAVKGTAP